MATFSQRLEWSAPHNELAAAETRLRSAGIPLLDLTTSNPTRVGLPERGPALAAALADPAIATYQPAPLGLPGARAAVAGEIARQGGRVDPDAIALTASSSESYAWLFKLLCDPGDVVLVPEPSYPLFEFLAHLEGVRLRRYQLAYDGVWHIDWNSLTAALPGARAVVVVNPNNPTGGFVRRDEHARLDTLAAEHGAALIVDEVFADYAFALAPGALLTVTATTPGALTFALGGLSKSCGLPQLKLGWIATLGPGTAVAAALGRLESIADTYLSVSTPIARALPALLEVGAAIRTDLQARIAENRRTLATLLDRTQPISALPSEAGWSAILRLPAVLSEEAWALTLLDEDHVLVHPGYFFDLSTVGTTIVASLLTPVAELSEALRRLISRTRTLVP